MSRCDADAWTAMYKEAMTLSEEVLEVFPDDEAAVANARAAKNSLAFRSKGMAQAVPMVSPLRCRKASTCCILYLRLQSCTRAV